MTPYDDDDLALLRAARSERAPPELRARALEAATAALLATGGVGLGTKAAGAAKAGGVKAAIAWWFTARASLVKLLVGGAALVAAGAVVSEAHDPRAGVSSPRPAFVATPPVVASSPRVPRAPISASALHTELPRATPAPAELAATAAPLVTRPSAPAARGSRTARPLPIPPAAAAPAAPAAAPPPQAARASLAEELALVDRARQALAEGRPGAALVALDAHAARHPLGAFAMERDAMRVGALRAAGRDPEARAAAARFLAAYPRSGRANEMRAIAASAHDGAE